MVELKATPKPTGFCHHCSAPMESMVDCQTDRCPHATYFQANRRAGAATGPGVKELRDQAAAQYRVVAHQAKNLAAVAEFMANDVSSLNDERLIRTFGRFSAEIMERLGDLMNGHDMVSEDDAWTYPIFEQAHATDWTGESSP